MVGEKGGLSGLLTCLTDVDPTSVCVQILVFNLPVNLAQGASVLYSFILALPAAPLTALQVGMRVLRILVHIAAQGCTTCSSRIFG